MRVCVTRGELVESVHVVWACAVDANIGLRCVFGDAEERVYMRSSAKPFIAAAIVASGAAARFGFEQREIALIAASHAGEPGHVEISRSILQKIGLDASALRCGDQYGGGDVLRNNCSGKHAGILALCRMLNADTETYLERDNPAQVRIASFCARMLGEAVEDLAFGVDGCGIPVVAASLRKFASAFLRLATVQGVDAGDARALTIVREAMLAEPWCVAGSERFDTRLMEVTRGKVVGKGGAEGVYGAAVPSMGIGLALKVADGASRAVSPAVMAMLEKLGVCDEAEKDLLRSFARPSVRNMAGRIVGEIFVAL